MSRPETDNKWQVYNKKVEVSGTKAQLPKKMLLKVQQIPMCAIVKHWKQNEQN